MFVAVSIGIRNLCECKAPIFFIQTLCHQKLYRIIIIIKAQTEKIELKSNDKCDKPRDCGTAKNQKHY